MHDAAPSRSRHANLSDVAILSPTDARSRRPRVQGRFLYVGDEKLWLRGITYGTFRPSADGHMYQSPAEVERDFASMVENGFNAIRVYTVPPGWLLDLAQEHGLYVMVGIPWEQRTRSQGALGSLRMHFILDFNLCFTRKFCPI